MWAERRIVECSRVWGWGWGSPVGVVTALQPGRSVFRSPTWCKKLRFLQSTQTGSGTHLFFYCFPGSTAWTDCSATSNAWGKVRGALPTVLLHVLMAWMLTNLPIIFMTTYKEGVNIVRTLLTSGTYSNHCSLVGIWLWFWLVSSLFRFSPGGSSRSNKPRHSQALWASFWTLEV